MKTEKIKEIETYGFCINKNNTIHFNTNEWENTDPDDGQFCHTINDHTFLYIQIKNTDKLDHKAKHALEHLNDKTTTKEWYYDIIDTNCYTEKEKKEYVAPYGEILDNAPDQTTINQLTAECIFETDTVFEQSLYEEIEKLPF